MKSQGEFTLDKETTCPPRRPQVLDVYAKLEDLLDQRRREPTRCAPTASGAAAAMSWGRRSASDPRLSCAPGADDVLLPAPRTLFQSSQGLRQARGIRIRRLVPSVRNLKHRQLRPTLPPLPSVRPKHDDAPSTMPRAYIYLRALTVEGAAENSGYRVSL
ncbi:hypothetical protein MSAN_02092600 [Mycena sanguinolenta]|uniref:Uncharacterized protein n=1 Tax=Mycena sanguinolenta TaxID=230812 RepID=A0A8H7CKM0_9AGAR|nr:hypothetical protein MSAN_02092600 [Mycena sanguinolenta]